jgi:hypothetical protein
MKGVFLFKSHIACNRRPPDRSRREARPGKTEKGAAGFPSITRGTYAHAMESKTQEFACRGILPKGLSEPMAGQQVFSKVLSLGADRFFQPALSR